MWEGGSGLVKGLGASGEVRKERQHLVYGIPPTSDKGVEGDRPEKK